MILRGYAALNETNDIKNIMNTWVWAWELIIQAILLSIELIKINNYVKL